ncbi:MAG: tRNA uridine-5-carboxymethylaminomethyl(34) synthesis enzyme MnmG, partial [Ghiorsea sp.]|nr:tRNA uridine-5-carboxymethylaminomethyl(34) synthesis enzyme MnmG [Ghiorsea sp.]
FVTLEFLRIPNVMDYEQINGLSTEVRQKLSAAKPLNLGQASRISGITPAAISCMIIWLKNTSKAKKNEHG